MEDFRKRQLNDRPAALEAKYDPEEEAKQAEADSFLGDYTEDVIRKLREGRGLEAGERAIKGAVGREVNAAERVSNYM